MKIVEVVLTLIESYLLMTFILATFAVIANKKALKRMNIKEIMLFFILQPYLMFRETKKKEKK